MSGSAHRKPPNPSCAQCGGTGHTSYSIWHDDDTWEGTGEVDCYCTFVPGRVTLPDPFPDRPDNGDGLPDPDRIDYARSDYL